MSDEGFAIWLTGLSGSGKTTIAHQLEAQLRKMNLKVEVLDGDVIRTNLSKGLGFSKEDRETHNKRVIFVANLLTRNGVIVIISLISPYREIRKFARRELGRFVEVWLKCSLETCIKRDPKGLYTKALRGEITNMTGLQAPYEEPLNPEVVIDTDEMTPEDGVKRILEKLEELGYFTSFSGRVD